MTTPQPGDDGGPADDGRLADRGGTGDRGGTPGEPVDGGTRRPGWAAVDVALRVFGGLVAVVATLVTAGLELAFAPLRVGGHLVWVSVPLAVLANLAIGRFAHRVTGSLVAVAVPALVWIVLMMAVSQPTSEGDYLLAGSTAFLGLALIVTGSLAFAAVAVRAINASARPARRP